jgi:hypothetical protein
MEPDENQPDIPELQLDKTKITVVRDLDDTDEIGYWRNATTKERLQHLELLRRTVYGARARARLQRTIEVVERETS